MIELQINNFNLILIFMLLLFSCNNRKSTEKDSFIKNKSEFENIEFSDVTMKAGLGSFSHDNGSFGKMWFPEQMGAGGGFIDYNSDGTTLTMTVSELNGTTTKLEVPLSGFGF